MTRIQSTSCKYALGLALIACLILGGGTTRGLTIDAALQVLAITCSTYTLIQLWDNPASKLGIFFFFLVLSAGITQLIPVPVELLELLRPSVFLPILPGGSDDFTFSTVSLAGSRTILSVIFALVPIYFFIALSRLSESNLIGLIPFYMIGVLCNLVAAVIQYSMASESALSDILGYQPMVGMFANVNHFSTTLFSSIPIILYLGIFMNRRAFALISLVIIFLVLLAAGSRAGILLGFAITVVSFLALAWRTRLGGALLLTLLAALVAYGYGAIVQVGQQPLDAQYGRSYFAVTTLEALKENWLFGIGYGVFDMVFPHYEVRDAIGAAYVNHAHNDFLEVVLEGGVLGATIVLTYVLAVFGRAFRGGNFPLQRLALLSILLVLVHSVVDYPLRTMAVAMSFAFFSSLLFSKAEPKLSRTRRSQNEEYVLSELDKFRP